MTASPTVMPHATTVTWSVRGPHDTAATDAHVLVRRGAHLGLAAQRAQVGNPLRVSAISATSRAVWLASEGCSTALPCTARSAAKSSSAICDGPSSPIDTPACDPDSRRSAGRPRPSG